MTVNGKGWIENNFLEEEDQGNDRLDVTRLVWDAVEKSTTYIKESP
jgi:hypothetical protein